MELNTLFLGKTCIELNVVDSTNNYAANLISTTKVHDGSVIMAHYQTNGRGQMGNEWHTEPSKNLTFSIVLYPKFLVPSTGYLLSKIVALSVKKAIEDFCPSQTAQIKWPNDIIVDGKKIAGILIENQWNNSTVTSIVGIGINVNQTFFEKELNATSCALVSKMEFSIEKVLERVVQYLEQEYISLRNGKTEDINNRYLDNLMYYKQSKPYKVNDQIIQGTIENVDNEGKLCVRMVDASLKKFSIKEITFLY